MVYVTELRRNTHDLSLLPSKVEEEHADAVVRGHLQFFVGIGQEDLGGSSIGGLSLLAVLPASQWRGVSQHRETLLVVNDQPALLTAV